MKNIEEVINEDRNLTVFSRGIIAGDLKKEWRGEGPFTVFAPSNLAFSKLDAGVFVNLEMADNKNKMQDLLNDHAVRGKIGFKDLKDGQKLETMSGKELNVSVKNNIARINGATIQLRDMEGWNGIVHSIDQLIFNYIK
jgi:uncharacterized surface protein with fasciclin (FAS1) repeats